MSCALRWILNWAWATSLWLAGLYLLDHGGRPGSGGLGLALLGGGSLVFFVMVADDWIGRPRPVIATCLKAAAVMVFWTGLGWMACQLVGQTGS